MLWAVEGKKSGKQGFRHDKVAKTACWGKFPNARNQAIAWSVKTTFLKKHEKTIGGGVASTDCIV